MSEEQEYEAVACRREGHVGVLEIVGPGKGNALGPAFWDDMPRAVEELADDPELRVLLVHGRGEHFTYGLDLMANAALFGPMLGEGMRARERMDLREMVLRWQRACSCLESSRLPVIAAIDGWCIGGGVNIIAAADMRICSDRARFSLREARIGITADLGALQRLPRIIGQGAARRMAMTAEDISAETARSWGLVDEVCPADTLMSRARELADLVAANAPLAVQGAKRVLNYCAEKSVADGLEYMAVWNAAMLQSHDLGEAMRAFAERRAPEFKGE